MGFITLGCDKNTVDSERYLAQLAGYGGEHVDDLSDADVIIVNTCGFIDAAKKESIDALVEAGEYETAAELSGSHRGGVHGGTAQERTGRGAPRG